jgi:hypothetical protein
LIAAVTLTAFTLLVAADKICCPDGCTDGSDAPVSSQSVPHEVAHTCLLCVGVEAPAVAVPVNPLTVASTPSAAPVVSLPVRAPLAVDHPPRVV